VGVSFSSGTDQLAAAGQTCTQTCALAQQRRRLHPRGRARSSCDYDYDHAHESDRGQTFVKKQLQLVLKTHWASHLLLPL
jgi:hypothetical protein